MVGLVWGSIPWALYARSHAHAKVLHISVPRVLHEVQGLRERHRKRRGRGGGGEGGILMLRVFILVLVQL